MYIVIFEYKPEKYETQIINEDDIAEYIIKFWFQIVAYKRISEGDALTCREKYDKMIRDGVPRYRIIDDFYDGELQKKCCCVIM